MFSYGCEVIIVDNFTCVVCMHVLVVVKTITVTIAFQAQMELFAASTSHSYENITPTQYA